MNPTSRAVLRSTPVRRMTYRAELMLEAFGGSGRTTSVEAKTLSLGARAARLQFGKMILDNFFPPTRTLTTPTKHRLRSDSGPPASRASRPGGPGP
jgi:hypothetical protein